LTPEASNRRYALLATTLAAFLTPFMGSAVNVALPRIGEKFGMKAITLGWVATSYILAAAIGLVPLGRLASGGSHPCKSGIQVHNCMDDD
jgi:MFS family permease